jgi:hypothetical protein
MLDPGSFAQMRESLYLNIGILCAMSGKLPSEIFDDPDWLSNFAFNIKISKIYWDASKARQ